MVSGSLFVSNETHWHPCVLILVVSNPLVIYPLSIDFSRAFNSYIHVIFTFWKVIEFKLKLSKRITQAPMRAPPIRIWSIGCISVLMIKPALFWNQLNFKPITIAHIVFFTTGPIMPIHGEYHAGFAIQILTSWTAITYTDHIAITCQPFICFGIE